MRPDDWVMLWYGGFWVLVWVVLTLRDKWLDRPRKPSSKLGGQVSALGQDKNAAGV